MGGLSTRRARRRCPLEFGTDFEAQKTPGRARVSCAGTRAGTRDARSWSEQAEIINGRSAMFFIVVGLLTELWTGQSIPEQVVTMARFLPASRSSFFSTRAARFKAPSPPRSYLSLSLSLSLPSLTRIHARAHESEAKRDARREL